MFWIKKKRKDVHPFKPQFHYIKEGIKWVFISGTCFPVFTVTEQMQIDEQP